ncbi:MAG: N-6 DNA methylase [Chloroflexi bacterium]|nr:N-6 DNA methylase [Chloroflexota bacterium]
MATISQLWSDWLLDEWLRGQPEYQDLVADPQDFLAFCQEAAARMSQVANSPAPVEAVTREDVILPLLRALGWEHTLTEQALPDGGTPDRMLFPDANARRRAAESDNPVAHAIGLTECKAWTHNLDRRSSGSASGESPAGQVRRYLLHAQADSGGRVRWAMLTNGAQWRLYSYDARPRNRYWEVDFRGLLQLEQQLSMFAATSDGGIGDEEQTHLLRVAYLVLHRQSWTPTADERFSLLDRLLEEGHRAEADLSEGLSAVVFEQVYPRLVQFLWQAEPDATPEQISGAAQSLLYRLLFVFYAEDRGMLPAEESPYKDNSARHALRDHIDKRYNREPFSTTFTTYWDSLQQLSQVIDQGDESIGIPEYNGGLFSDYRNPLLSRVKLNNRQMAEIVQPLSVRDGSYINYRDLSIRELGGIYERLLELLPVRRGDDVNVMLQPYARKDSGSYYTPQELVDIIVEQTLRPLVEERIEAFRQHPQEANDPADAVLQLRVLDPAMGSGHFLLTAIDWLTEQLSELVNREWAEAKGYVSPLRERLWDIQEQHPDLSDDALIQRMVLKRCIYGVDKNSMAVELAKVALWLHSFSGALPLPFLDHRLKTGDSLLGIRAESAAAFFNLYAPERFGNRFPRNLEQVAALYRDAAPALTDPLDLVADEVHEAAEKFSEVDEQSQRYRRAFNLIAGVRMLSAGMGKRERDAWLEPLRETFRNGTRRAIAILYNGENHADRTPTTPEYREIRDAAFELAQQERMLHWELEFPQVTAEGGFDAVIGNPPWDRIEQQEPEWFEFRDSTIGDLTPAARRKEAIERGIESGDELCLQYDDARRQAARFRAVAKESGDFPSLSGGRTNIYSLFVERSLSLLNPRGVCGLLTPSGIYADKTASAFFRSVSTSGRLAGIYDFENRRQLEDARKNRERWFDDVDSRFKFCATVIGGSERRFEDSTCGFFLDGKSDLVDQDRVFSLAPTDFQRINPNTGTAPILRNRRDAELVSRIYREHPVLVDQSGVAERRLYPIRFTQGLFNMTSDSGLFQTAEELESQGAYRVSGNRYRKGAEEWAPLYQGRMIHHFDHRANHVAINPESSHNPYVSSPVSEAEHRDASFFPGHPYWVSVDAIAEQLDRESEWAVSFRDTARPTDERTMFSALVPWSAFGNTLPLLLPDTSLAASSAAELVSNLNSLPFDYVATRKVHGAHLNWFIVEQLPLIHPDRFGQPMRDLSPRDLIRDHVLRLTYTAADMQPFARDLGFKGEPFTWDAPERRQLRARLDALFFHLYGLSLEETTYVLDQFTVLEKNERREFGDYLTKRLVLGHYLALASGDTESEIAE